MNSAEFIYQLGFDAGADSQLSEIIKAHDEGRAAALKGLVNAFHLDEIESLDELNEESKKTLLDIILVESGRDNKEKEA